MVKISLSNLTQKLGYCSLLCMKSYYMTIQWCVAMFGLLLLLFNTTLNETGIFFFS